MRISDWSSDVCSSDLRDDGQKSPDADADAAASAGPDLVWIDASDGGMQIIGRADGLTRPHFGPDRNRIFFSGGRGNTLVSMRLDGSDRRTHLKITGVVAGSEYARDLMSTRSEEHTSELQSLMRISYAVFCLKKKNNKRR